MPVCVISSNIHTNMDVFLRSTQRVETKKRSNSRDLHPFERRAFIALEF